MIYVVECDQRRCWRSVGGAQIGASPGRGGDQGNIRCKILHEEFMKPMEVSINSRSITADTALRLGKYFGVSPELWLNLQVDYDLRVARRNAALLAHPKVAKVVKAIELRDSTPLWTDDFNNLLRVLK